MQTSVLFNRNESGNPKTFAVLTFTSKQSQDPKVLIEKLKAAVTKWINTSTGGDDAWGYSGGDFNIGDFASYEDDPELNKCLSDEGITVNVALMNEPDAVYPYDAVLANEDEVKGFME
jgi:hypothetical protein